METLNQLRAYNNWANGRLFQAFENYGASIPASSLLFLSHIINAQETWVSRINKRKSAVSVWQENSLEFCKALHQQNSAELEKIISGHETDLYVVLDYQNTRGDAFQNTLFDILFHMFNHGTYHRAQIAMDMRQNGLEPVNTDYINFVR